MRGWKSRTMWMAFVSLVLSLIAAKLGVSADAIMVANAAPLAYIGGEKWKDAKTPAITQPSGST